MRRDAIRVRKKIVLKNNLDQIWPYFSNTDAMNKYTGSREVTYDFQKKDGVGTQTIGETVISGIKHQYFELPYNWIERKYGTVERFCTKGLLKYIGISITYDIDETGLAFCELELFSNMGLINRFSKPILQGKVKQFVQYIKSLDQKVTHVKGKFPWEPFLRNVGDHQYVINKLTEEWSSLMPDSEIPIKVAEILFLLPDEYAKKIRPLEIAEFYELDKENVLIFCLRAVKKGFLILNWDILCPSCMGKKGSTESLNQLDPAYHCDSCGISYATDFDKNVEVSFQPKPRLRKISLELFCFGSVSNTPHIAAQITLDPGESRKIELFLDKGTYNFSRLGSTCSHLTLLNKSKQGTCNLDWNIKEDLVGLPENIAEDNLLIHLHNTSDDFQSIKIERRQWYEYAVKAFMLTSFQEFTDLFHSQVLRPGLELGVSQIVLMFTDLKDSTQLYDEQGDAKAFSLVHDHYEIMKAVLRKNRGTIVKTIGDAIMASFQNPEDALVTAVGFLESFAKWNKEHAEKEQIILKIGFHMGPSLLLNQNGMLDYFGQTVNTAARIQGQSKGNDIVISREIYQHTRIQKKIKQLESSGQTFKMEKFSADLKGISQTTELIRLVL